MINKQKLLLNSKNVVQLSQYSIPDEWNRIGAFSFPILLLSIYFVILNEKSKNPGIVSIKKICDGLGITLGEFFSTPDFDHLGQEIK